MGLYEQALHPRGSLLRRALLIAWQSFGLTSLLYLAWFGLKSWSHHPIILFLRGVLLVETFGYIYHRWFQHVSPLTRVAQTFRRNQRFHWIHHMIIYPIGTGYRKVGKYIKAEFGGIAWSWVVPGILIAALFTLHNGANWGTLAFIVGIAFYSKCIVSNVHSLFHIKQHFLSNNRYFRHLENVHLLHHWDQRYNFTIVCSLFDLLFGTYLSPATHQHELKVALQDKDLTVSDVINWKYLLIEATPAEYAAFISAARQHLASLKKLDLLIELFREQVQKNARDLLASNLLTRATQLKQLCVS